MSGILELIKGKNPGEREFHQAVQEVIGDILAED